jgi:cyclophilin family peptidyl-prolyl cis-trans isomerase
VNNFVFLARDGFYDGVIFHRVEPGFVVQAGDPQGTGRGGPGYNIQDEKTTRDFVTGTLGMAKTSAPNSAGSQWFICLGAAPHLTGNYTAFGQLVSGQETLSAIKVGTKITKITIEEQ